MAIFHGDLFHYEPTINTCMGLLGDLCLGSVASRMLATGHGCVVAGGLCGKQFIVLVNYQIYPLPPMSHGSATSELS
jgi:hypothetical protein